MASNGARARHCHMWRGHACMHPFPWSPGLVPLQMHSVACKVCAAAMDVSLNEFMSRQEGLGWAGLGEWITRCAALRPQLSLSYNMCASYPALGEVAMPAFKLASCSMHAAGRSLGAHSRVTTPRVLGADAHRTLVPVPQRLASGSCPAPLCSSSEGGAALPMSSGIRPMPFSEQASLLTPRVNPCVTACWRAQSG